MKFTNEDFKIWDDNFGIKYSTGIFENLSFDISGNESVSGKFIKQINKEQLKGLWFYYHLNSLGNDEYFYKWVSNEISKHNTKELWNSDTEHYKGNIYDMIAEGNKIYKSYKTSEKSESIIQGNKPKKREEHNLKIARHIVETNFKYNSKNIMGHEKYYSEQKNITTDMIKKFFGKAERLEFLKRKIENEIINKQLSDAKKEILIHLEDEIEDRIQKLKDKTINRGQKNIEAAEVKETKKRIQGKGKTNLINKSFEYKEKKINEKLIKDLADKKFFEELINKGHIDDEEVKMIKSAISTNNIQILDKDLRDELSNLRNEFKDSGKLAPKSNYN